MSPERKMQLLELICRLIGHKPVDTGRPSGVRSCARCFDVLP